MALLVQLSIRMVVGGGDGLFDINNIEITNSLDILQLIHNQNSYIFVKFMFVSISFDLLFLYECFIFIYC